MTKEERAKMYAALSAPFPAEAIQRTNGSETGRGYSTVGIGYQYVCNRLCEVLGLGGFRAHRVMTVRETVTSKGRPVFEAVCEVRLELGEWIDGAFVVFAEAVADGGHVAVTEGDARKGSFTGGLKKAAAMLGCGREAYEGSIDDDNLFGEAQTQMPSQQRKAPAPAPRGDGSEQGGHTTSPTIQTRERLTNAQLGAIKAIVRRRGLDPDGFRAEIQRSYGVTPEFLTRRQASDVIGRLDREAGPAKGNGVNHGEAA